VTTLQMTAINPLGVFANADGRAQLVPAAELVLIGTRPDYRCNEKGEITPVARVAVEFRCVATEAELRALAQALSSYADDLAAMRQPPEAEGGAA